MNVATSLLFLFNVYGITPPVPALFYWINGNGDFFVNGNGDNFVFRVS